MAIAFNDLKAQYAHLKPEIDAQIAAVLESGAFISGPQVKELEQALCTYTGRRHCVTVSNGTDALIMPLMAWGIGAGDAVFVPAFTFVATAEAVSVLGAVPVFCDVDEATFNLDAASLRRQIEAVLAQGKLTPRAVISVDLFGLPADYEAIRRVCDEFGLLLLEDAAQGFGGEIHGKKACNFGDASATSFFPAKPLGCYGDGGAVFTDDPALAQTLESIRVHGKGKEKYDNVRVGLNARLDTLQAAILLPKLRAFDTENAARNRAAAQYTELLGDRYDVPRVPEGFLSSWAQYTIRAKSPEHRAKVQAALKEQGIPTMVYYPRPLHLQPVYAGLGYSKGDLPVSERLAQVVFSLPMHGYLTDETVRQIGEAMNRIEE